MRAKWEDTPEWAEWWARDDAGPRWRWKLAHRPERVTSCEPVKEPRP